MTEVTDEQKREVKAFIDNLSTVYTDTLSKVWEVLGLDTTSPSNTLKQPPESLDGRPPTYRGSEE